MGAGSDAHVLPGGRDGRRADARVRRSEEFLISLRSAEVLRRPKSLVYLQGLKWMAQARDRRTKAGAVQVEVQPAGGLRWLTGDHRTHG